MNDVNKLSKTKFITQKTSLNTVLTSIVIRMKIPNFTVFKMRYL